MDNGNATLPAPIKDMVYIDLIISFEYYKVVSKPAGHKHIKILSGFKLESDLSTTSHWQIRIINNFAFANKILLHIRTPDFYNVIFSQGKRPFDSNSQRTFKMRREFKTFRHT